MGAPIRGVNAHGPGLPQAAPEGTNAAPWPEPQNAAGPGRFEPEMQERGALAAGLLQIRFHEPPVIHKGKELLFE